MFDIAPLEKKITEQIDTLAPLTDKQAKFPRPAIDALSEAG